jgi:hypothetical protein
LLLFLILFCCFSPAQTSARTKKHLKTREAITCARERAAHGIARKKATASGTGINEIHNLQEHDASFIRIIASLIILNLMLQTCKGGIMIILIFVSGSH